MAIARGHPAELYALRTGKPSSVAGREVACEALYSWGTKSGRVRARTVTSDDVECL